MPTAQKCPVCDGSGKLPGANGSTATNDLVTCHGCGGRGWVVVPDYPELPPLQIIISEDGE